LQRWKGQGYDDGFDLTAPVGSFPAGANFTWTLDLGGTFAVLYGVTPSITLTSSGAYRGVLRVADSLGNTDDDLFMIFIRDERPPTVRAGADFLVCDSDPFVLSGAGSFDNDPSFSFLGNYTWTIPLVADPLQLFGVTVALRIEVPGTYLVVLTARDPPGIGIGCLEHQLDLEHRQWREHL